MEDPTAFEPPVVVVLSGGNIDPLLLSKVIRHGLIAAGRFLSLRRPDPRPAGRARQAARCARGARVPTCSTWSTSAPAAALHVDEVEVELQLETRGGEHSDRVVAALREQSYPVDLS